MFVEDSFLVLDALERDLDFLRSLKPSLCLEIGSGSGCNITFLGQILLPHKPACLGIDINSFANKATMATGAANGVSIDAVRSSMVSGMRLDSLVDVLIFNPPYVPTEELPPSIKAMESSLESCLEAAWAGGKDGRYWIDILMPLVPTILSPCGAFYMVVVDENRPQEIMQMARTQLGLQSCIVIDRRARNEHLSIVKFTRINS